MKKGSLIILLQILTTLMAISQSYIPIPLGNSNWHYREYNFGSITKSYNYFSKDTTGYYIQGRKYWRIDRVFSTIYAPSSPHYYLFDDTANQKIYAIFDTITNDQKLLYDFSANVGDTIYNLYSLGNDTVKVDSVKYILDQHNVSRKHLFVHSIQGYPPQEWVEGVGSMYELFIHSKTYTDPVYGFICHEVNNQIDYGDSIQCSNFLTSINDNFKKDFELYVTTNSYNRTLVITNPSLIRYKLEIADISGRKLFSKKLSNSFESITISNYVSPFLVYQITVDNNRILTGKIFIN